MKFFLFSFSLIISILSGCGESCGSSINNNSDNSNSGQNKNNNQQNNDQGSINKIKKDLETKKQEINNKIEVVTSNLNSKNLYSQDKKDNITKEINNLRNELNAVESALTNTSVTDKQLSDLVIKLNTLESKDLAHIEKNHIFFNDEYQQQENAAQANLSEELKKSIKNANDAITRFNKITDQNLNSYQKTKNKKDSLEKVIKDNNKIAIDSITTELTQLIDVLKQELTVKASALKAQQEAAALKAKEEAERKAREAEDKEKEVQTWITNLEINKAKKDIIASLNLQTKEDFITVLNDNNKFVNLLYNLEGCSAEQRSNLIEAIKEINDENRKKYIIYVIGFCLSKNFSSINAPHEECQIFQGIQNFKNDKNYKDHTLSTSIKKHLDQNYKNCQNDLKNMLNILFQKTSKNAFSEVAENDRNTVITRILESLNSDVLNKYVENISEEKDIVDILSSGYLKYNNNASILMEKILSKIKNINLEKVVAIKEKIGIIFKHYADFLYSTLNDNSLVYTTIKENSLKILKLLLSDHQLSLSIDKDTFNKLKEVLGDDELLFNYIKNSDDKADYLTEKQIYELNPERLAKIIDVMKYKNLEISNKAVNTYVTQYKRYNDSHNKNNFITEMDNIKKVIKLTLANVLKVDSITDDDNMKYLLSEILITDEDRKEFYELLEKLDNKTLENLSKNAVAMMMGKRVSIGFSEEDKNLITQIIAANVNTKQIIVNKLTDAVTHYKNAINSLTMSADSKANFETRINNINSLKSIVEKIN